MVDINPEDVKIVWVSNSYDGLILAGHAWWLNQYCYIKSSDDFKGTVTRMLFKLEGEDLLRELATRKMFEDVVGYHCTKLVNVERTTILTTDETNSLTKESAKYKVFYKDWKEKFPPIKENREEIGRWVETYTPWPDDEED